MHILSYACALSLLSKYGRCVINYQLLVPDSFLTIQFLR